MGDRAPAMSLMHCCCILILSVTNKGQSHGELYLCCTHVNIVAGRSPCILSLARPSSLLQNALFVQAQGRIPIQDFRFQLQFLVI
jgi:hypothetical protein